MSASLTQSRLARLNTASSWPSADSTTDGFAALALRKSEMLGVNGIRTRA